MLEIMRGLGMRRIDVLKGLVIVIAAAPACYVTYLVLWALLSIIAGRV